MSILPYLDHLHFRECEAAGGHSDPTVTRGRLHARMIVSITVIARVANDIHFVWNKRTHVSTSHSNPLSRPTSPHELGQKSVESQLYVSQLSHSFVRPIVIRSSRILYMALYGRLFSLIRPSQFYVQTFEARLGRITEIPLYPDTVSTKLSKIWLPDEWVQPPQYVYGHSV